MKGNGSFGRNSRINYIIPQDFRQDVFISDYLQHGSENATPSKELSALLGLPRRTVTRMIEAERRKGCPICANSDGYYLAGSVSETEQYLQRLVHREAEIRRTRVAVAQTLQTRMNIGGGDRT